ncbi:MAG TPA: hypothetical protein VI685_07960 [Candidatus Angelobacter sp.]
MLSEPMNRTTFVICCECGSSIFANDSESVVRHEGDKVTLRCLNNCCGHVGTYLPSDLRTGLAAQIVDHTTDILFHG